MSQEKFYITTPIYYVNDSPHIGHAYTSLACDVLARFKRLDGAKVKFLTGTDEHGQKVEKSASIAGKSPQAFTDEVSQRFRDLCKLMNFSNDDFIRTTEPRHIKSAQELWRRLEKNGHIYLDKYAGWYSVRDEAFYTEAELVEGKAPTGADVEWVEEESYFFDLSKWQEKLLEHYEKNPDFIAPESRRNEVISFVKGGLKDLSISRTTFTWGIPVPGNDKHIMYVWLDALANYLSADGFGEESGNWKLETGNNDSNLQPPTSNLQFWPANLHVIGKDILRFHAVYWPAFLMAANLPLPKKIFAGGWWTVDGQKMSKSLGNVVAPSSLVEKFGLDQTRYFLLREFPFGQDGNFSEERMIAVTNSELANNVGNLVQRTLSMIQKNCGGMVPGFAGVPLRDIDKELKNLVQVTENATPELVRKKYLDCKFQEILTEIIAMSSWLNSYIDKEAPWVQKKTNPELMAAILYYLAEGIRCLAIMLQPFIPDSAGKILDLLAVSELERRFGHLRPEYALKPGVKLPEPVAVFPRFIAKLD